MSAKLLAISDVVFSSRFLQQSAALTYKNVLVAWRSRRATILRLMAPFMFLLLALVIQLSLDANNKREQRIRAVEVALPAPISPIPSCNEDLYIGSKECVTFLYSPNNSAVVQDIINNIKATNSPRIEDNKVLGFASRAAVDDYMMKHPETALGAVHFDIDNSTGNPSIQYIIQTNTTTKAFKGNTQSPVTFFTMPLMAAVAREASRFQVAAAGRSADEFVWDPKLVKFPHPQLRSISMVGYVLGPFIFAACMFGMVTQLAAIVGEKESGLVTSLRHMGLLQSSYWCSWVMFDLLMGLLTALSIVMWGNILQFRFFLRNDPGLLVALFWLFTLAMSSFSYFLSVFMSRQQSATYTGFAVFLIGWICQTVAIFGLPYNPSYYYAANNVGRGFFWVFACLPWCPLIKGCLDLAAATSSEKDPGIRWNQRESYCQYIPDVELQPLHDPTTSFVDFDCIYPISQCLITLLVQAGAWLALAVYLDNVWPTGHGKTRPLWYFLLPSYWANSRRGTARHLRKTDSIASREESWPGNHSTSSGGGAADGSSLRVAANLQHEQQQGRPSHDGADAAVAIEEPAAVWGGAGSTATESVASGATITARGVVPGINGAVAEDEDVAVEAARMKGLLRYRVATMGSAAGVKGLSKVAIQALDSASAGGVAVEAGAAGLDSLQGVSVRHAVEVYGLSKVFKGNNCCKLPCSCGKGLGDFWAIAGSWFGIPEGQLFCLLGPNGAGKTTTINCLTGILPPSGGDVLVCGESIGSEGGLDRVRPHIGVCPQFDVLWGELTGLEHLVVAGNVKGLRFSEVRSQACQLLERVQLLPAAGLRSTAYSGGMKRRLSVALALLGDPKVLYLDEPTTGMDPISRRYVWDVIQAAKPGRAIVLTTHSMEEADILGDRIAIMARGRLKAIGSSIRLKQKFGAGYQVVVTMQDAAKAFQQPGKAVKKSRVGQQVEAAAAAAAAAEQPAPADLAMQQREVEQGSEMGRTPAGSSSPEVAVSSTAVHHDVGAAAASARQAVKDLFAHHLSGWAPVEESKWTLRYSVPRNQQQQLMGLLELMEKEIAANAGISSGSSGSSGSSQLLYGLGGVSDVQLSLTSLEEVFLSIAKQAELEAAAVTGATVTIQLPDTGRSVEVAVGQDWVDEAGHAVADQGACQEGIGQIYRVKWVQDESGVLTVLEVVPTQRFQQQQLRQSGFNRTQTVAAWEVPPGPGHSVLAPVCG